MKRILPTGSCPVRYYMEVALGILLKGVGLKILWPQFVALAATAGVLGAWSVARLKRAFMPDRVEQSIRGPARSMHINACGRGGIS